MLKNNIFFNKNKKIKASCCFIQLVVFHCIANCCNRSTRRLSSYTPSLLSSRSLIVQSGAARCAVAEGEEAAVSDVVVRHAVADVENYFGTYAVAVVENYVFAYVAVVENYVVADVANAVVENLVVAERFVVASVVVASVVVASVVAASVVAA